MGFNRNIMGCKVKSSIESHEETIRFNRNIMGCKAR